MSRLHAWNWADYQRSAQGEEIRARAAERRARLAHQDGAEDGRADGWPVREPREAPSTDGALAAAKAAPASGQLLRTRSDLAAPGARPAGVGADPAPAVPPEVQASPGLCWARETMARGISLAKVLSSGGDRLTWRDRDVLRGRAPG